MDKQIECRECGQKFVFTDGEQLFYEKKGFVPPVRCANCRKMKKIRDHYLHEDGTGSYIPGAPTMKSPSMNRAITWMCCVNGGSEAV